MSIISKLKSENLIKVEEFVLDSSYEVLMGSIAYGANTDSSDIDVHSICVPPLDHAFPHLNGVIHGFGKRPELFETCQKHGITYNNEKYDVMVYSIMKAFTLASECNPNVLDLLWVPDNCILKIDRIGSHIRANRKLFLGKNAFFRFRGYAQSQMNKLTTSPRKELVEKYGFDTKYASHVIRIGRQCKQILSDGDMDLTYNADIIKAIRSGQYSKEEVIDLYEQDMNELVQLFEASKLRQEVDMQGIHTLLLECLEMKYGDLTSLFRTF